MNILGFIRKISNRTKPAARAYYTYEFCPRCEANLTLQKGYSNELPYWICKGCGEMLINPVVPDDIAWICDECESMLNIQPGFTTDCKEWACRECGYVNKIDATEIYATDDEYRAHKNSPLKGMSDKDILELMQYREISNIDGRDDIVLVEKPDDLSGAKINDDINNPPDNNLYVKKTLSIYDASVYRYLMSHPIVHMPRIYAVCESDNNLIIIEEYIEGRTLAKVISDGPMEYDKAAYIARSIACILKDLHSLDAPIIHRDIKPTNIIIGDDGEVYIIDINVAKWYHPGQVEDTNLLGTLYYAAPEQFGYGFAASSEKSDVYALGVLLNVMVTGQLPKENMAGGEIRGIVEKCICLEPDDRYSDDELIAALDAIVGQ